MSAGDEIADDTETMTGEEKSLDPRLNDLSPYQGCFACGLRNSQGLRLTFWAEGDEIVTEFTPDEHYQGFPGVLHGGILATLLDEALSRTASIEGR
ncbi:MAG TPA: PaaI family thioesterase, partial [Ktedonobacterales bacterium]|nr:PaaI family thioesterase [Ktedonobacterales bacterium]